MLDRILFISLLLIQVAFAAGGFGKAEEIATDVQTTLHTLAVVVVAIAFMIVGYRMIFQGARFVDVLLIFIGGIIIGASLELAAMVVEQ